MKPVQIIVSIFIAQAAGVFGAIFTNSSVNTWYMDITKPAWNPPSWIFGPVWITLFTLMGIAAYLVWRRKEVRGAKVALAFYGVHLVLNVFWSIFFFGLQNPFLAFLEILLLLAFILVTTVLFWKIDRKAGILFVPYIAWVFFATFLNYTIWQLN